MLSTLKQVIHLSQTTITSLSTLVPNRTRTTTTNTTCPCPFNPRHHRLPPESLFRHFLHCPSSPTPLDPSSLLQFVSYPITLQSSSQLINQPPFLHDPNTDLCFSLDDYFDFCPNSFYKDCPGVVTSSSNQQNTIHPMLKLPYFLSIECVNSVGSSGKDMIKGFDTDCIRLLPSEIWSVRSAIEAWNEYPSFYSFSILRTILCLKMNEYRDFMRWVIANSSQYGVVIDVPMRDHIVLLFRLCLKASIREAVGLANSVFNNGEVELSLKSKNFECPVLGQVLKWLASQLSVLYGQVNGKLFALNLLKQCLLNSLWHSSLYPPEQKETFSPLEKSSGNEINNVVSETIVDSEIFVSQVAAAVAALHERSFLEEKIKALRDSRPLTAYQRMAEHSYTTKRADEERQKRANYIPIIEHDGLLWQHSHNQETNKMKTREQLLAEERDYKRRRMSYRGKKLKRSTTQVMRDIIEEYMERIKHAGKIGCLVKGAAGADMPASNLLSVRDSSKDVDDLKKNLVDASDINREMPYHDGKQLHLTKLGGEHSKDKEQYGQNATGHSRHLEARRDIGRDRHDREYHSRSLDGHRSSDYSLEKISNQRQQHDPEVSRKYLSRSPVRRHKYSHEYNSHRRERVDHNSELKDSKHRKVDRNYKSDSAIHNELEDRYDPSESCDMNEDDVVYISSKYVGHN